MIFLPILLSASSYFRVSYLECNYYNLSLILQLHEVYCKVETSGSSCSVCIILFYLCGLCIIMCEELDALGCYRPSVLKFCMTSRFLKARKFNIEKAKCMWANMLQWKRDLGTDSTLKVILFVFVILSVRHSPFWFISYFSYN